MLDVLSTLDSRGSCLPGLSDPPVLVERTGLLRNRCKLVAEMVGLERDPKPVGCNPFHVK